jgi:hypothetical protein
VPEGLDRITAARRLALRAARNKDVRRAAASAGAWLGKKGGDAWATRRRDRRRAYALARQIGGRYSEDTIVAGRERLVVWKDGRPIDCFPPLSDDELRRGGGGSLAERAELQGFDAALLRDPPPLR